MSNNPAQSLQLPIAESLSSRGPATIREPASEKRTKSLVSGYWVCTALIALAFLSGGIGELIRAPQVMEGMTHLGYPTHVVTVLGIWKVLGGIAILVPGFPLLKEWAYAGMFFDLSGAAVAHAASGDEASHILTVVILAAILIGSWALRPPSRRLG